MIYLMCSFERAIFQKSLSLNCESDWYGLSWLERRPVTAEVVGSNPIRVVVIISQMITCWKQQLYIWGLSSAGEHLPYKQRVTGSSPVGPINFADLAQWQSS